MIDRTKAPELNTIEKLQTPNLETIFLENKIPFYYLPDDQDEAFRFEIYFPAGSVHQEKLLQASFTNNLLLQGSFKHNSAQIAEKLDYYGAYLQPAFDRDNAGLVLYSITKYAKEVLEIMADCLLNPIFPEKEFHILRSKKKQEHQIDSQKVKYIAARKFQETLFSPTHPYGKTAKPENFDQLAVEDCRKFYTSHYLLSNATMILSGKVPDDFFTLIDRLFGQSLISKGQKVHWPNAPEFAGNKYHFVEKKGAVQNAIRLGRIIPDRTHQDYPAILLYHMILGGYFGSRLMANIREDKGYTYGIQSFTMNYKRANYLGIVTETASRFANACINEIHFELGQLMEHKVENEELNRVKNYFASQIIRQFDGTFTRAETLKNLLNNDLQFNYTDQLIEKILKIDAARIQEIANRYFTPDDLVLVHAGAGS